MNRFMTTLAFTVLIASALVSLSAPIGAGDDIYAHADKVSGQVKGSGADVVVLEGNVVIRHGKTVIKGQRAVYDKKAGSITLTGGLLLTSEDIQVDAAELVYLRRTKEGTFRGNVRLMRTEQKDDAGKVTKDAFTLTCGELVFASEAKNFRAREQAVLVHKDFAATAGEMVYDDAHQELTLTQQPTLTHQDETIKADVIVVSIEADTFRIERADITFAVEEKE